MIPISAIKIDDGSILRAICNEENDKTAVPKE
jgi:hypothetical protein